MGLNSQRFVFRKVDWNIVNEGLPVDFLQLRDLFNSSKDLGEFRFIERRQPITNEEIRDVWMVSDVAITHWLALSRVDGKLVASTDIRGPSVAGGLPYLNVFVDLEFHGQGIGTELCKYALTDALSSHEIESVLIVTMLDNIQMQQLVERGLIPYFDIKRIQRDDAVHYHITREP